MEHITEFHVDTSALVGDLTKFCGRFVRGSHNIDTLTWLLVNQEEHESAQTLGGTDAAAVLNHTTPTPTDNGMKSQVKNTDGMVNYFTNLSVNLLQGQSVGLPSSDIAASEPNPRV